MPRYEKKYAYKQWTDEEIEKLHKMAGQCKHGKRIDWKQIRTYFPEYHLTAIKSQYYNTRNRKQRKNCIRNQEYFKISEENILQNDQTMFEPTVSGTQQITSLDFDTDLFDQTYDIYSLIQCDGFDFE